MAVATVDALLHATAQGRRLTLEEGVRLYRKAEFLELGQAARAARFRHVPERRVTYLVDRNVNGV